MNKKRKNSNSKKVVNIIAVITVVVVSLIGIFVLKKAPKTSIPKIGEVTTEVWQQDGQSVDENITQQESESSVKSELPAEEVLYEALSLFQKNELEAAFENMKEAAELGNPEAQYLVGQMLLREIGNKSDRRLAGEYVKKAFLQGVAAAYPIYGRLCYMGDEVEQDYELAAGVFVQIADEDAEAACALGIMSYLGQGVPIDYDIAYAYLIKASEEGYEKAEEYLAIVAPKVSNQKTKKKIQIKEFNIPAATYQYTGGIRILTSN